MILQNISKITLSLAAGAFILSSCTLYDNYDMDLMQGVIANIESSSSYCDDEQCGTDKVSSSSKKSSSSNKAIAKSSSSSVKATSSSSAKSSSSSKKEQLSSSSSSIKVQSSSSVAPASSNSIASSSANKIASSSSEKKSDVSSSSEKLTSSSIAQSSSAVEDWDCGMKVKIHEVEYNTVLIKDVCVIAENLQHKPTTTADAKTVCYGNNESNCAQYGRLYNYAAASRACPSGWKLPTKTQLETMRKFTNEDNDVAGIYFKSKSGWDGSNGNDRLGFNALPGGSCEEDDSEESGFECLDQQKIGLWWTSTEEYVDSQTHYALELNAESDGFFIQGMDDNLYLSVRCVMK